MLSAEFSLNNETHARPPFSRGGESEAQTFSEANPVSRISTFYAENFVPDDTKDKQRNLLNSELRQAGIEDFKPVKFWDFISKVQDHIAELAGLENDFDDPERPRFDKHNFLHCYSPKQSGLALYNSENETWKVKKFSCCCKYCFWCKTRARARLSASRVDFVEQLAAKGVDKLWRLQFTIPKSKADIIINNKDKEKYIRKKIVKFVRKAFGVKTEDNMAIDVIYHPVGSNNLMEDHPHFHIIVYPYYVRKNKKYNENDKNSKKFFEYIAKCDKLDLEFLKNQWNEALKEVYETDFEANQPQVSYIPLQSKKGKRKTRHAIKYDFRAFNKDFEEKAVKQTQEGVVIKCKKYVDFEPLDFWRGVSYRDYAERWMYVVDNMSITPYGLLHCFSSWVDNGIFTKIGKDVDKIEDYDVREMCDIHIIRGKEYCKQKQKIIWKREEWAYISSLDKWLKIDRDASWFYGDLGFGGVNVIQ